MRRALSVAVIATVLTAPVSVAQTNPAPAERYLVSPIEDGILRVDRRSGLVSVCRQVRARWTCTLVPDDLQALKREIDQLSVENLRLRSALAKYDPEAAIKQAPAPRQPRQETRKNQLPTEEEIDRAASLIDRMMRRFLDTARDLRRDYDIPPN